MSTAERIEIPVGGSLCLDAIAAGPETGELVLLLHGFPQTSHSWHRLLPRLAAAGYRAVAPDGRGLSPRARPAELAAYRVEALVGDVLAAADHLGARHFHLVGHDWGGIQAWQTASRAPERVRSLAVASTPHPTAFRRALEDPRCDQRARSAYFATFRTPGAGEEMWLGRGEAGLRELYGLAGLGAEDALAFALRLRERAALTGLLAWYRADEPPWDVGIGAVRVPTLYCWGSEDPALGREAAEWSADCVEAPYRFEVFEGSGHGLPENDAERLGALLLDHLCAHGDS
jgi:pimeloyl-ACP methyl ester carboxylesterase